MLGNVARLAQLGRRDLVGGHIAADLDDRVRPADAVLLQRPAHCHVDAIPHLGRLHDLAFPASLGAEDGEDRVAALRQLRAQQLAGVAADGLVAAPAVQLLRPLVPEGDQLSAHIPRGHRVVCEIEELGGAAHPLDEQDPVERRREGGAVLSQTEGLIVAEQRGQRTRGHCHDAAAELRIEHHSNDPRRVGGVTGDRAGLSVSGHLGDELPAGRPVEPVHGEHLPVVGGDHRPVGADETSRPLHGTLGEALPVGGIEHEIGERLSEMPFLPLAPESDQPTRRLESDIEERQHRKRRQRDRDLRVVPPQDRRAADGQQQRHHHPGVGQSDRAQPSALHARHRRRKTPQPDGRLHHTAEPHNREQHDDQLLPLRLRPGEGDAGETDENDGRDHHGPDGDADSDGQPVHRRAETEERKAGREEECDREVAGPQHPIPREHRRPDGDPATAQEHDRARQECARSITPAQPPVHGEYAQHDAGTPQSPRQHKGRSAQGTVQYQPEFANSPTFTAL